MFLRLHDKSLIELERWVSKFSVGLKSLFGPFIFLFVLLVRKMKSLLNKVVEATDFTGKDGGEWCLDMMIRNLSFTILRFEVFLV